MLLVGQFSTQTPQPLHFTVSTSIAPLNAILCVLVVCIFYVFPFVKLVPRRNQMFAPPDASVDPEGYFGPTRAGRPADLNAILCVLVV
jgi:hypothetical protein